MYYNYVLFQCNTRQIDFVLSAFVIRSFRFVNPRLFGDLPEASDKRSSVHEPIGAVCWSA